MCYEPDSRPPIRPIAGAAIDGRELELTSGDGAHFQAFVADAPTPTGAGVVILPDVRGLHDFYRELALRLAEAGVDALAIDYFGRTAGVDPRPADFEFMPHVQQTRYAQLREDVRAGAEALRHSRPAVHAVFTIGFCFGGRLAFLSATRGELGLAGAIGFYGVVAGPGRAEMPPPLELAGEVRVPVLGLFGGEDLGIPPESVEQYRLALGAAGVEHELVVYPGAPHSFFDRKAEQFADESADAWRRVLKFIQSRAAASSR
ncbi:MAG TPA: dienelactone hydrolase family protein [Candidatus Limnocylindria bacterium]|nr:dienelactone hydrolase family protein [Candidatus Limnocylindria bacterium]